MEVEADSRYGYCDVPFAVNLTACFSILAHTLCIGVSRSTLDSVTNFLSVHFY